MRERGADPAGYFHVASLSTETIVYKGLLLPRAAAAVLPRSAARPSSRARSRSSTRGSRRTRSRPGTSRSRSATSRTTARSTRCAATATGCRRARASCRARSSHGGLERLFPIIVPGKSDSAQFDNMVELLTLGGRTLPHAMMMMIPEAWESGTRRSTRSARRSIATRRRSSSRGTARRRSCSPTASSSARRSIATACAPRAGRSRPTTA